MVSLGFVTSYAEYEQYFTFSAVRSKFLDIKKKFDNRMNILKTFQFSSQLIDNTGCDLERMSELHNWSYVVDQVNEKILRTLEWKSEVNTSLKQTNLFIDGIIDIILLYADYEKTEKVGESFPKRYNYFLYGSIVGLSFVEYEDRLFSLTYMTNADCRLPGLWFSRNLIRYSTSDSHRHARWRDFGGYKTAPIDIIKLLLEFHRREINGYTFDAVKWNNSKNLLDYDSYFIPPSQSM